MGPPAAPYRTQGSMPPHRSLRRRLDALHAALDAPAILANDPLGFVHRYTDPADQEVAGLWAAGLAFGRVSLFSPVLDRIFDLLDRHGGPRAAVDAYDPRWAQELEAWQYRWIRGHDLHGWLATLHRALPQGRSVEALFADGDDTKERLTGAVERLRSAAAEQGVPLTRGLTYFMPSPASGSACKRWNLYLRWMVRPPTEGLDLGLWTSWRPKDLVMPLDTHTGRLGVLLGLLERPDSRWRQAVALTDALRAFDRDDPLRYDVPLAHVGISAACKGKHVAEICDPCPLRAVCSAPPRRRRRASKA